MVLCVRRRYCSCAEGSAQPPWGQRGKMTDPFLEMDGVENNTQAMRMSLLAALQRNKTYVHGVPDPTRKQFRAEWEKLIRDESERYAHCHEVVSDSEHCAAISRISHALTHRFAPYLVGGRLRFGTSQKAFNLYLKYLWRLGTVRIPPPHCPVDAIVLTKAGISGSWTQCDSDTDTEYMEWRDKLRQTASSLGLADWEYEVWRKEAPKRRTVATRGRQ